MSRQARKKSSSGIYHIMLRGINQQQIFEDSEDFNKFLQVLKDSKAISEFKIFAYCLMGNHIHLLIQKQEEFISFNNENSFDECLDIKNKAVIKVTDEQAQKIIEKYSKCKNVSEFQSLDIKTRDRFLKKFNKL